MSSSSSLVCLICCENPAILECPYCDTSKVCVACVEEDAKINEVRPRCFNPECRRDYSLQYLIARIGREWCASFLFDHLGKLSAREGKLSLSEYNQAARRVQESQQDDEYWKIKKRLDASTQILTQIQAKFSDKDLLPTGKAFIDLITSDSMQNLAGISSEQIQMLGYLEYYRHEVSLLMKRLVGQSTPITSIFQIEILLRQLGYNKSDKTSSNLSSRIKCQTPDCLVYLLGAEQCPSCSKYTCEKCLESLSSLENHVCDPNILKSIKSLKKSDGRPCPRCNFFIERAWGCDQMFCTQCHTFFNYRSGKIYQRAIHNPEYSAFLQAGGKLNMPEPSQDCNALPDFNVVTRTRLKELGLFYLFPVVSEMEDYISYQRTRIRRMETTRRAIGVMYLIKMIDESRWQKYLAMVDIRIEYLQIKIDIMSHFQLLGIQIYRQMSNIFNSKISIAEIVSSISYFGNLRRGLTHIVDEFNHDMSQLTSSFNYGEIVQIVVTTNQKGITSAMYRTDYSFMTYYEQLYKNYRKLTVAKLKSTLSSRGVNVQRLPDKKKDPLAILAVMTHRDDPQAVYPRPCTHPRALCLLNDHSHAVYFEVFTGATCQGRYHSFNLRNCLDNPVHCHIAQYGTG